MTTDSKLGSVLSELMNVTEEYKSFDAYSADDWLRYDLEKELKRTGTLDMIDGYNCDECKNRGYMPVIVEDSIAYQPCKCQKVRKSIGILKQSGLEGSIKKIADFETPEDWQKNIKERALSFIKQDLTLKEDKARCFYIGGQSGAGKTHICSAIAREFIKQGKATRYVMWVQMIERLKDYKDDTRASYADDLCNVDVLYIDDYFKPDGTGAKFTRQDIIKTFEVIDKRYKQPDKITIISSELTIYDISAIDEATAGRIREMAKSYVLDIPKDKAKNYRMR